MATVGRTEKGERGAGEQVRGLVSGPGEGSRGLEGVVETVEEDRRLPEQIRGLISPCPQTPSSRHVPGMGELLGAC